jgi:hypothetical protein
MLYIHVPCERLEFCHVQDLVYLHIIDNIVFLSRLGEVYSAIMRLYLVLFGRHH